MGTAKKPKQTATTAKKRTTAKRTVKRTTVTSPRIITLKNIEYDGNNMERMLFNRWWDGAFIFWLGNVEIKNIKDLKNKVIDVYLDTRVAAPNSKRGRLFQKQKQILLDMIDAGGVKIKK